MLDKTRAMLAQFPPGTYVADDVECYDEAELVAFGQMLASLVYAPSKLRRRLEALGVSITRSDFYSAIPGVADLEASFARTPRLRLDHPFRDTAFLQATLRELSQFAGEFDPPRQPTRDDSFAWEGGAFSYSDAMAYYCMIRRHRPRTIVEIGCGASTLIASMACERNGHGRIIAIEPFPAPYLSRLPRVELLPRRIQDVETGFIDRNLADGDILFIDSTHTVKHDSDCLHIYLRILPHLASSLFVHAHDIYLPGEPAIEAMRDRQVFWSEQYLLYAYLVGNPRTRILYGSAYHHEVNPELLDAFMHGRFGRGGASLWFQQDAVTPGPRDQPPSP